MTNQHERVRRARHKRQPLLVFGLLVLYTFGPFLCVLVGATIAHLMGIRVDESGGLLYALCMAGWLALITIPTGLLAILVNTAAVLFERRIEARKRDAEFITFEDE
jgi:hypothetical protein